MSDSFYPAAKKVFSNPVVRWLLGLILAGITATLTTGIYPFFQGWVATRASTEEVSKVGKRIDVLEGHHIMSPDRLNLANADDVMSLSESEKIKWLIIRTKRLQEQLVVSVREQVGLEVKIRMPRPNSPNAKLNAAAAMRSYDSLILHGEQPHIASQKALEEIFGK